MAEKTDEEIIKEVGLETTNDISEQDALDALSLDEPSSKEIENSFLPDGVELEELTAVSEDKPPNTNNNTNNTTEQPSVIENEDKDDDSTDSNNETVEEEIPVQKKRPKIFKILIGIVAFLALILITGVILYFTGFFDPEPPKPMPMNKVEKKAEPEIIFNDKDINKSKLNKKLTALTKTEIMNKEELEAEEKRIQEEEKKKKEAEQKAIDDKKKKEEAKLQAELDKIKEEKRLLEEHRMAIKKEQEEFIKLQEQAAMELEAKKEEFLANLNNDSMKQMNNNETMNEDTSNIQEDINMSEEKNMNNTSSNMFLPFINVATIKGDLYKSYLDKVLRFDKNASLCRDLKNRIEIYFGPYDSEKERNKVLNNLLENGFKQAYLVDFTQEEYQKRCEY